MASELLTLLVVVTSAIALALGGVLTHLAYRAYRRTHSPVLRALTAGFGLVTLGLLFGGGVHQVLGLGFLPGLLVQRLLTLAGFGLLVYSLYSKQDATVARGTDHERRKAAD